MAKHKKTIGYWTKVVFGKNGRFLDTVAHIIATPIMVAVALAIVGSLLFIVGMLSTLLLGTFTNYGSHLGSDIQINGITASNAFWLILNGIGTACMIAVVIWAFCRVSDCDQRRLSQQKESEKSPFQ